MALPLFQYSGVSYTGQPAGTTTFALTTSGGKPIGYLLPSHIHVYSSSDNGITLVELTRPAQWDFNTAGTAVELTTGIADGMGIVLQRITPHDGAYTQFGQGTLLTAEQLNDATTFTLYLTQESDDEVAASVVDSTLALSQSTTALSQSTTALDHSIDAMLASDHAVADASQALSTANEAKSTADGAATVSGTAIQRADSSLAQSSSASTVSASADAKATAALAAVADASIYNPVASVAELPLTPIDGYKAQVDDSTGVEDSPIVTGLPSSLVGDAGVFVRLNYNAATSMWQYASYGANDPDSRYVITPLPVASTSAPGIVQLSSVIDSTSQAVAATASAVKTVADSAAAASGSAASAASAAAAAQATASAALPKAGGTLTGNVVFSPSQDKAATGGVQGITTLSDSTSSDSSAAAATSKAVKAAFDVASAAMPKAGGTFAGPVINTCSNSAIGTAVGPTSNLEVRNTGGAAFMTFFRQSGANPFAGFFGLDNDNKLKVGGWSFGDVAHTILHSGNYTSYQDGRAYPRLANGGAMNFAWSGQGGQPTWLWGGNDGTNYQVYNPSNFSVNYAASAGTAAYCTGDIAKQSGLQIWSSASIIMNPAGNVSIEPGNGTFRSPAAYGSTTASAGTVFINAASVFMRSTSSIKYKESVEDVYLSKSESIVYNSRPVWYRSLCEGDPTEHSYWGFIAEEVAEIDARLVHFGDDGPEGVQYDRYVVHLVKIAQAQKQMLDDLIARITALEDATG